MAAETLQDLEGRLARIEDLGAGVSTMKALAAVNIQHFENAAAAAQGYFDNVLSALQILLINEPDGVCYPESNSSDSLIVAIGSDQGMVGQFNELVADKSAKQMNDIRIRDSRAHLLSLGPRAASSLLNLKLEIDDELSMAGNLNDAVDVVRNLLDFIADNGQSDYPLWVVHNRPDGGASYKTAGRRILPLDRELLDTVRNRNWEGRSIPQIRYYWDSLFYELSREYLFVAMYTAVVESLASENAARLAAMQAAENNIEEKKEQVGTRYNQQRQYSITSELLDIVSGFESLGENKPV